MTIRVTCPNPDCGAVASVEEPSLGRRGRCKRCGLVFALARPDGEPASAGRGSSPARSAASPTDLPEQFGRYRIRKPLGQGGMGAVYLAYDTKLDRRVALKVPFIHPSDGPQAVQRFEREARAAATLDHPNLCPIHDIGEVDGIHYLTMPYIEGQPLSQAMDRNRAITEPQAAAVTRKLALALREAHEKGVIHRDLKPGNIMVNRRRELIIMDFGLARMASGDQGALTRTGHVLGTALYMAPEQAAGDVDAMGPACDVYSLGVILHELLTGRRPFEGPWSLVIGLKSVMDPGPPSKHRPDLSPALDALCLKAIARDPGDRYRSMAEFADALSAFLTIAPGPSPTAERPESLAAQAFAGIGGQEATSDRSEPAIVEGRVPRWTGRARILVASGLACFLLLGIIIPLASGVGRIEDDGPKDIPGSSRDPGFAPLPFDPELSGWSKEGRGSWSVSDEGELTLSAEGIDPAMPAILETRRDDFRDFTLRFELWSPDDIRKGLFVRLTTGPTLDGYAISVGGTRSPLDDRFEPVGSIHAYRDAPPDEVVRDWDLPAIITPVGVGQWQTMEITAIGNRISTRVGGREVARFVDDRPGREAGKIRLLSGKTSVKYRNMVIRELPAPGEPIATAGRGQGGDKGSRTP